MWYTRVHCRVVAAIYFLKCLYASSTARKHRAEQRANPINRNKENLDWGTFQQLVFFVDNLIEQYLIVGLIFVI